MDDECTLCEGVGEDEVLDPEGQLTTRGCPECIEREHKQKLTEANVVSQTTGTFPHVLRFAERMEFKLSKNRHKGDALGWRQLEIAELFAMLRNEVDELALACAALGQEHMVLDHERSIAVWNEAADVGNFAMMIADTIENMKHRAKAGV